MAYSGVSTSWPAPSTVKQATQDPLSRNNDYRSRGYFYRYYTPVLSQFNIVMSQWTVSYYDIYLSPDFIYSHENTAQLYIDLHGLDSLEIKYHTTMASWRESIEFILLYVTLISEDPTFKENNTIDSPIIDLMMIISSLYGLQWTRQEFYDQSGEGISIESSNEVLRKVSLFLNAAMQQMRVRRWSSVWQVPWELE